MNNFCFCFILIVLLLHIFLFLDICVLFSMENTLFQLKFTGKQLDRLARKAEKQHGIEKNKIKRALEQKNVEAARIYSENAIRKRNESLNYMRMSARIDAVQSRVQSAVTMRSVVKDIGVLTKGLERAMESMKLEEVESIMSKFEQQFDNLSVMTGTVESAMSSGTALSAPTSEVDGLMKQIADEAGLDIQAQLAELPETGTTTSVPATAEAAREQDLTERLQALRG